jgi:hypothetical protein
VNGSRSEPAANISENSEFSGHAGSSGTRFLVDQNLVGELVSQSVIAFF